MLRGLIEDGLKGAKIFVGADTEETLRELEALRTDVPGAWDLMVDALWSYEGVEAAAAARSAFAGFEVAWLECPLLPEDLEGHRRLQASQGVPIALGEHFFTHHQSEPWLAARALQVFQPEICRTGISDGRRQATMAEAAAIAVTPHMGTGSPLVQATALQFRAAARSGMLTELQLDLSSILPDVFDTGWSLRHGRLQVPDRPGLGVEIDEPALARYCKAHETWRRPVGGKK
jgi:D-galactarolactone cycloisomerase